MIRSIRKPHSLYKAAFLAMVLALTPGLGNATDWTVQKINSFPGTPGPSGDYSSIQDAIDDPNTLAGDTILVLESWESEDWSQQGGTGTPPAYVLTTTYTEDIVFPSKNITIKSALVYDLPGKVIQIHGTGSAPSSTSKSVVSFLSANNTRLSVLEGFEILGGWGSVDPYFEATGTSDGTFGGGIQCFNAFPTIRKCTIFENHATAGGGMSAHFSDAGADLLNGPLIEDCIFRDNHADTPVVTSGISNLGGGLFGNHCSPEIVNCIFEGNSSLFVGGGVAFDNWTWSETPVLTPKIERSFFLDNTADGYGGGAGFLNNANAHVTQTSFTANRAGIRGGGLYWDTAAPLISTCFVNGNEGFLGGGGIAIDAEGVLYNNGFILDSRLEHCTITRNRGGTSGSGDQGGGLLMTDGSDALYCGLVAENCLFAGNKADDGGGIAVLKSKASFVNCTIAKNFSSGAGGVSFGKAGGIFYDPQAEPNAGLTILDSVLDENVPAQGVSVSNSWEVNLYEAQPVFSAPTVSFCMMAQPGTWPVWSAGTGNLAFSAKLTTGPTSTYFPNGHFYLSHSPQQAVTSQGYDSGSGPIHSGLAVFEMVCRTASTFYDVGRVDIGFHYPKTELIPMP